MKSTYSKRPYQFVFSLEPTCGPPVETKYKVLANPLGLLDVSGEGISRWQLYIDRFQCPDVRRSRKHPVNYPMSQVNIELIIKLNI